MNTFIKILFLISLFNINVYSFAQVQYLFIPDSISTARELSTFFDKKLNNISLPNKQLKKDILIEQQKAILHNDSFKVSISWFFLGNYEYMLTNYVNAINYFQKSKKTFVSSKFSEFPSIINNRIGRSYVNIWKFDSAIIYFNKALKIQIQYNDSAEIVNTLNFLGKTYQNQGKYDSALNYFSQALKYVNKNKLAEAKAFTYSNLGKMFTELGDFDYAEKYLKDALYIRKRLKEEIYVGHTYYNLAVFFSKKEIQDSVIDYCLKAISIFNDKHFDRPLPKIFNLLGYTYLQKNNDKEAIKFLISAKQLAQKQNDLYTLAENAINFGLLFNKLKQYEKAIEYLQNAINIAKQIHSETLAARANKIIANSYFNTTYYKEAYLAKEEYEKINKKIFNNNFAKKVAKFVSSQELEKMSLIFKYEQKEKEIKNNAKIQQVKLIRNIFIIASLLFLIFAFLLYNSIRQKIKANKQLEISNSLIAKNQEQILAQRDTLIKQKKELSETLHNLQILQKAIEQSPSTIVITDINGNIEYINPIFETITGYSFNEVKGNNPRILKSGIHDAAFYKNLWDTILSGEDWRGEFENKRKNGEHYFEHVSISPVKDESGEITHFIAIKEDTTEQHKLLSKLEKLTAIQTKIFSVIGHDLRSPLGSINSILELLINKDYVRENTELSTILEMILKSISSISFLSENLLNWGNNWLQNNKLNKQEFIINQIIDQNIQLLQNTAKNKNIELVSKYPAMISVFADMDMISIIVRNLIANAIKFTPKNGKIEIITSKLSETEVEISVKDSGIGIKKELIPVLLDEYNLYTSPGTESEKGSGLGLSICLQFLHRNGGHLKIESSPGKGSTFKFTIPTPAKK